MSLISGKQIHIPFELSGSSGTFTYGSGSELTIDMVAGSTPFIVSIRKNGEEVIKINSEGVLILKSFDTPPTAVTGGLYYSNSNSGTLYLGVP